MVMGKLHSRVGWWACVIVACAIMLASWDFKPSSLAIVFVLGGFLAKYPDTDQDSNTLTRVTGGHRNVLTHSGLPQLAFFIPLWLAAPSARLAVITAGDWGLKFIYNLGVQFVAFWALATATHLLADLHTPAKYKKWKFLWWFCWGAFLFVASVATIVFLVI